MERSKEKSEGDGVLRKEIVEEKIGKLERENWEWGKIKIIDIKVDIERMELLERRRGKLDKIEIKNIVDRVVMEIGKVDLVIIGIRIVEDEDEIKKFRIKVVDNRMILKKIGLKDDMLKKGEKNMGKKREKLLRKIEEEVDEVLRSEIEKIE